MSVQYRFGRNVPSGPTSMAILKKPGEDRPSTARKRRLWSIGPAPRPSAQWFEGYLILEELPTDLGLMIFQWYRGVLLWMDVRQEEAQGLFMPTGEDLEVVPELLGVRPVFVGLIETPEGVQRETLCSACSLVSEWASTMGFIATSVQFSEAAALLDPRDPDLCFRAGRANRHFVAYDRAVLWFQRGTGIARRSANWTAYIDCWLGWGNLEIARGRYNEALRQLNRAYRAATKYNLPALGAAAQHDMFMLAVDRQNFGEAYQHALAALALYDSDDPNYPYLIHDLAQTWALDGYGALALPLLVAMRRIIVVPSAQIQIEGNIAGAAGQNGDMDTFFSAWDYVSANATKPLPYVAAALVSVAEGAYALKLYRQAAEAATTALRFAKERQEPSEEHRALALLENLRLGEPPPALRVPPSELRDLARTLVAQLNARAEQR